jgi:GT2 family glycosyltransferase
MSQPLISVCIAAFNADKHLESTLRSVSAQTHGSWELIVTEDGSSDRTQAFVQAFAATVPQRVIYNRHETNQGVPATRNTGIAAAGGEWVALLDSDDLWKPDHLASLVSASQIEEPDLVFAGSVLYDNATWTKLGLRAPTDGDLANLPLALFTGRLAIASSAVMIRREALQKFGPFSKAYANCSSNEYWLRLLSQGGRLSYSGANTCIYRQNLVPQPRKATTVLSESARICEQYASWSAIPRSLARERPASLYRQAGRSLLTENPTAALESLFQALRLQPLSPKTLVLCAKVYLHPNTRRRRAA